MRSLSGYARLGTPNPYRIQLFGSGINWILTSISSGSALVSSQLDDNAIEPVNDGLRRSLPAVNIKFNA
jgi:hypothetical protein